MFYASYFVKAELTSNIPLVINSSCSLGKNPIIKYSNRSLSEIPFSRVQDKHILAFLTRLYIA